MAGTEVPDPLPRRSLWKAPWRSGPEPAAEPAPEARGGVRAGAERSAAVGGNAEYVVTGDGNTFNTGPLGPQPPAPPSEQDVARAVVDYVRRFEEEYGGLELQVLAPRAEEHPAVPLSAVFVAPSVRADPPPVELPRELRRRLALSGELPDTQLLPPGVDKGAVERLRNSYLERPEERVMEVLAGPSGRRVVLLGDPGAGKSMLVRHLALSLGGRAAGGAADGESGTEPGTEPGTDPGAEPGSTWGELAGRVPLVVELRQFADARWGNGGFEEFLDRQHRAFGLSVPAPVRERLLAEGRAVVVFDGLDEVFAPEARKETARRIAAFAARHPSARIVVTSRIIGYVRTVLDGAGFSHFTLQDLDPELIAEFTDLWYHHAYPDDRARADGLTERITSALEASRPLLEVAGNPLLLTILVIMGSRGPLPRNRRDVYEHAVEVLVEQWDQAAKFLKAPLTPPVAEALEVLGPGERLALLRRLARTLQEGSDGVAGNHIDASGLQRFFRDHLGRYGLPALHAAAAARAMVTQLHERNFILSCYGGTVYGFVHRAFLEHLAAADIAHRYREEGEWTSGELIEQVVAARAADPTWHEVLLLLIGQLDAADATAAVDRLLGLHARRTDADDASLVVLALRALAEMGESGVPAPQSVAVVDAVTAALEVRGSRGPWLLGEAASALGALGRYSAGRERYLRWYRLSGQFSASDEPAALLAFHLRLDDDELTTLARGSYHGLDRLFLLYERGRRRPDEPDEEVRERVAREAATGGNGRVRAMALEVLGELWADREDVRTFLTGLAAEDPHQRARTAALEGLALGRPEDAEVRSLVMGAAVGDDHPFVRGDAMRTMGRRWSANEEVRGLLMRRAREDDDGNTRSTALRVLTQYARGHRDVLDFLTRCAADDGEPELSCSAVWHLRDEVPRNADVRALLVRRAEDAAAHDEVSTKALNVLGSQGPGHTGVREVLKRAARSSRSPEARSAALRSLGEHWSDHEGVRELVLRRAREDPEPAVRSTAVQVMGERYPGHDEAREVLIRCMDPTAAPYDEDVSRNALCELAEHWAGRPEVRELLVRVCPREPNVHAYATVLRALAEHWSGRRDVHELILGAAGHADRLACATVLDVLEDHWPDHDDVRAALMRTAADAAGDWLVGSGALKVLTKRWADRADVREFLLSVAEDTSHRFRDTVLNALGHYWAHREDVRDVLTRAVSGRPDDPVGADVVKALGRRWAGHPDVRAALRRCAVADPQPEVRFAALRWWVVRAGEEEGEALARARAVDEPDAEFRRRVVHMLALGWPSSPRAAAVLRDRALRDEDERIRAVAEDLLGIMVAPAG
ncbi:HEAT repeat domain-containing protein [Streptomyces sp. NPDC054956]